MTQEEILGMLAELKVVIVDSHLVYTSGAHGSAYVNKDALYPHVAATSQLARELAARFVNDRIEVVVGPAIGGVIFAQWVAHHLSELTGSEVLACYAERWQDVQAKPAGRDIEHIGLSWLHFSPQMGSYHTSRPHEKMVDLAPGGQLIYQSDRFEFKRGQAELICAKRVLVIEDVLTTGGSAKSVIQAVRRVQGSVLGLGVLCNRGGVTPEQVGDVPKLVSLIDLNLSAWPAESCPLCADGIPINTTVGKGKDFLASQAAHSAR